MSYGSHLPHLAKENSGPTIAIIIPVINEAGSIGNVIREIPAGLANNIIVVDGGSTDDTVAVAEQAGARVIVQRQRGYGRACLTGVLAANADVLVFLDGDHAEKPAEIPRIITPILEDKADLVLGARTHAGISAPLPPHQIVGNRVATTLIWLLHGLKLSDLGPYKAIRKQKLLDLHMSEMTYGWTTEMVVKAARQRYRIVEVPVSSQPRYAGQSKVGGTLKGSILAGYSMLMTIIRHQFVRMR